MRKGAVDRQKVIDATDALISEGGLETAKARAIADKVGVATGSLYYAFGDLNGLLCEVGKRVYDAFYALASDALDQACARGDDVRAQLMTLADAYIRFVQENKTRWGAVMAFNARPIAFPEDYLRRQSDLYRLIERALQAGPCERSPELNRRAARVLFATVHGVIITGLERMDRASVREESWARIALAVDAMLGHLERECAQA
ncbi:MAG: TetR/AcrR family transcriptional regulator [Maricaulaceae bacterium]